MCDGLFLWPKSLEWWYVVFMPFFVDYLRVEPITPVTEMGAHFLPELVSPDRCHEHHAKASSTARAARKTVASSKCLPRICAPMGRPCDDSPQGTDIPQIPARLAVTV